MSARLRIAVSNLLLCPAVASVAAANPAQFKKVEGYKVEILSGASPGDQVIVVGK
jgi:hypothetical protein